MRRALILLLILFFIGSIETEASQNISFAEKSLYSMGNTARLKNTMLKARREESLVVGFIGGSITQGARATRGDRTYVYHVAKWWKAHFPDTEIKFINAGIGSTDSNIGAFRVYDHLLKYKPDFVVVEYAVNDSNTKEAAETLEGITRQVLKAPNNPAMLFLFMCKKRWGG
jgi:acyl-CoA thioesterase-1